MIDKKQTNIDFWSVLVIFSIGVILFIILLSSGGDNKTSTHVSEKVNTNNVDDIDLHIQAQQFVLQGLISPSTAKFPALPSSTSTDGKGLYQVVSYVDSQNGFSAMIRSDWSVTMRLTNEEWTPEKIIIGGKVVYDPIQTKKNQAKAIEDRKKLNQEIDKAQMMIDEAERNIKSWQ
jgi:hypothetical protein